MPDLTPCRQRSWGLENYTSWDFMRTVSRILDLSPGSTGECKGGPPPPSFCPGSKLLRRFNQLSNLPESQ
jgi:hypothetical protein